MGFNSGFKGLRCRVVSTSLKPKPEDHPLSAVRDCLLNIFAATLNIGGRSSIRNLRTHHAVVTGTHLSRPNEKRSNEEVTKPMKLNYYSTNLRNNCTIQKADINIFYCSAVVRTQRKNSLELYIDTGK
jgi:hypothetical protein